MEQSDKTLHTFKVAPEGLVRVHGKEYGDKHPEDEGLVPGERPGESRTVAAIGEREYGPGTERYLDQDAEEEVLAGDEGKVGAISYI